MEQFITDVLLKMQGKADMSELKKVLYMVGCNYNITPKKCELRENESSWCPIFKMFLDRKYTSGLSANTLKAYRYHIGKVLSYINKDIKDITETDLYEYFRYYKQYNNVSNTYLNNIRRDLSAFFSWCNKKNYISHNPIIEIDPFKENKVIKRPYTDEELETLKMACKDERDRALLEFLYSTAVRLGELVNLNINDVDFRSKEVIVNGKGSKERIVFLSDIAIMRLKEYLDTRTDDCEALFVSKKRPHQRLNTRGVQTILRKISDTANISGVHCHKFRRTTATNLLKKGTPLEEVQFILGHSSPETTLIYAKINKENAKNHFNRYMSV